MKSSSSSSQSAQEDTEIIGAVYTISFSRFFCSFFSCAHSPHRSGCEQRDEDPSPSLLPLPVAERGGCVRGNPVGEVYGVGFGRLPPVSRRVSVWTLVLERRAIRERDH
jgi:hypothetical protein